MFRWRAASRIGGACLNGGRYERLPVDPPAREDRGEAGMIGMEPMEQRRPQRIANSSGDKSPKAGRVRGHGPTLAGERASENRR
jgi:hypothetical protein